MVTVPGLTMIVSPSAAAARRESSPAPATPKSVEESRNLRREKFMRVSPVLDCFSVAGRILAVET
jgi:hypothetical protein